MREESDGRGQLGSQQRRPEMVGCRGVMVQQTGFDLMEKLDRCQVLLCVAVVQNFCGFRVRNQRAFEIATLRQVNEETEEVCEMHDSTWASR